MRNQSCIVGKQKFSEENFRLTLVFDLSRARLKNLLSVREQRKMPAFFCSKGMFQDDCKKDSEEGWGQHTALLDSVANIECLRHVAVESNGGDFQA